MVLKTNERIQWKLYLHSTSRLLYHINKKWKWDWDSLLYVTQWYVGIRSWYDLKPKSIIHASSQGDIQGYKLFRRKIWRFFTNIVLDIGIPQILKALTNYVKQLYENHIMILRVISYGFVPKYFSHVGGDEALFIIIQYNYQHNTIFTLYTPLTII